MAALAAVRRALVVAAFAGGAPAQQAGAEPAPMVVDHDVQLEHGKVYGPLVITASNVRVDGNGAHIVGPGASGGARTGVGVGARGVSGVQITGIVVAGFETGLGIEGGSDGRLTDCDFSDNFTDPEFGWGEQPPRGGVVLRNVVRAALQRVTARRVQDGCCLIDCDH